MTAHISTRHKPENLRRVTLLTIVLLVVVSLGAGCQQNPPPAPPQTPPPVEAPPTIDPALLARLLHAADDAIARDQFTYPEAGSALALYREILSHQPDQKDALHGLERIVEHFIAQAMRSSDLGQFASARSMLARARLILPEHPSIEPTAAQIRLLSQAQRTRVRLKQEDLKAQTSMLRTELHNLAETPASQQCRFMIRAISDAQGRWIYQTMSDAVPGTRLRAQIQIRSPAEVERICYPT